MQSFVGKVYAACDPKQGNINLADCLTLGNNRTAISEIDSYKTPAGLVNLLVSNLFVIAGILIFISFIVAGFKFVVGGKNGIEDAKKIATAASVGFIIMFSAYWIVAIVEQITGAAIVF